MNSNPLSRGARGGGVIVGGQLIRLCLQFVGVIVLSRLLTPSDFGLIAMVMVFIALGDLIRDFGMPTAALQAKYLDHQQASNAFWINSALGVAAASLVLLLTPVIVWIYDEPTLGVLAPSLSVVLVLNGVQAQVQVQLARSMKYLTLAITDTGAQLLGLAAAIIAASSGWGYWSLVVQAIAAPVFLLVGRLFALRWLPAPPRRGHGSKQLVTAGVDYGLAHFLTFASSNIDTISIGVRYGADATGLYNRAFQLLTLPMTSILSPLTQVVIPTTRAAREAEPGSWQRVLSRVQFALGGVSIFVFAVSASLAGTLIPALLGPQWQGSVILFQLLALGGCFQVLSYVSYWGFIVNDLSRQLVYYNLVTKPLAVVLIVVGASISVEAVAAAYALGLALSWPINLMWLRRAVGLDAAKFAKQGGHLVAAGLLAFAVGIWLQQVSEPLGAALSVTLVLTGVFLTYSLLVCVTPAGRQSARTLIGTAVQALSKR